MTPGRVWRKSPAAEDRGRRADAAPQAVVVAVVVLFTVVG
jgi:hypothetical protein